MELTAVIAIITVLVSLLCAALNQTKAKALRITCLDNMKQLQLAWEMYTDENDGSLPLNQTAPAPSQHHRIWARELSDQSWVVGNPVLDVNAENIRRGTLFPNVQSVSAYHCPMDYSRNRKGDVRTRSYSMNAFLGGDERLKPKYKFAEITRPESTFVFVEEHEESLWESSFVVIPVPRGNLNATAASSWLSTPSDRHNQGCNITFADGRIEYWRWYSPKAPLEQTKLSGSLRDVRDLHRLQSASGQN